MTHTHNHGENASARQLSIVLGLVGTFLVVEVVYGLLSGSLALLSDAGHMLTDAAALALSLFAIKMGQRPADKQRTFGYRRAEILAAALNAGVLLAIGIYILYEAYLRLRSPVEVQTTSMLIVAVLGLIVNVISARLLVAGSTGSLNVKSAYLEVLGDLLGSVAVIVGALLIRFTRSGMDRPGAGRVDRAVGHSAHLGTAQKQRECADGRRARGAESGRAALGT